MHFNYTSLIGTIPKRVRNSPYIDGAYRLSGFPPKTSLGYFYFSNDKSQFMFFVKMVKLYTTTEGK